MGFIVSKNDSSNLDLYFFKSGVTSIHRPSISQMKVDDSSKISAAYSIGFEHNLGFTKSISITGGTFLFEVLEGFPLQSLMSYLNKGNKIASKRIYRLQDLPPLDFFCVNKTGGDPFGEFIIKNLKFTNTRMEQGVQTPGRYMVANFVASKLVPFRTPYFFNNFISDDYSNHYLRNKDEITNIISDVTQFSNNSMFTDQFKAECISRLNVGNASDVIEAIEKKKTLLAKAYSSKNEISFNGILKDFKNFIAFFYENKNSVEKKNLIQMDSDRAFELDVFNQEKHESNF